MHLERADGGDDDHRIRREARLAALDVEEFLGTQVGAEAGFGHRVFAQAQAVRGHHGVAAVRDVGERAAVHEGRVAFQRLHQVRHQRVLQQHGHGAVGAQVLRADGLLVARAGHDDVAQAAREIVEVGGEAEDGHHFRGHDDVEAVFAREAVARSRPANW